MVMFEVAELRGIRSCEHPHEHKHVSERMSLGHIEAIPGVNVCVLSSANELRERALLGNDVGMQSQRHFFIVYARVAAEFCSLLAPFGRHSVLVKPHPCHCLLVCMQAHSGKHPSPEVCRPS